MLTKYCIGFWTLGKPRRVDCCPFSSIVLYKIAVIIHLSVSFLPLRLVQPHLSPPFLSSRAARKNTHSIFMNTLVLCVSSSIQIGSWLIAYFCNLYNQSLPYCFPTQILNGERILSGGKNSLELPSHCRTASQVVPQHVVVWVVMGTFLFVTHR